MNNTITNQFTIPRALLLPSDRGGSKVVSVTIAHSATEEQFQAIEKLFQDFQVNRNNADKFEKLQIEMVSATKFLYTNSKLSGKQVESPIYPTRDPEIQDRDFAMGTRGPKSWASIGDLSAKILKILNIEEPAATIPMTTTLAPPNEIQVSSEQPSAVPAKTQEIAPIQRLASPICTDPNDPSALGNTERLFQFIDATCSQQWLGFRPQPVFESSSDLQKLRANKASPVLKKTLQELAQNPKNRASEEHKKLWEQLTSWHQRTSSAYTNDAIQSSTQVIETAATRLFLLFSPELEIDFTQLEIALVNAYPKTKN